jgi:alkanesulfonate monooxygenase SsuD/methylene tetrahydromethanopterin reductase-like flavin-dependent oxidoreductase (luciferase family)
MQLNAFFPSLDIGNDPAKIRDWAQAAEDLGYAYIEVPDHVFGATARDGWVPLYNEKASFHETFVTLGFLAAVTKTIRLSSGGGRSLERRALAARHRPGMEPRRV